MVTDAMRQTLSVIIIAGNEERNIGDCLASVARWANEVVVVDSQTTDRTVEIAKQYTDRVIVHPWEGYAGQKRFALSQATSDWILSIDADERVTLELRASIETALLYETVGQQDDEFVGYTINRRNFFLGTWIRSCFWYPDYKLRLFRRGCARVTDSKVHEGFVADGKVGTLAGDLLHYSYQNLHDAYRKINTYSTLAAEDRVGLKRVRAHDIVLHPLAAFLTDFLSRKGYRDGMHGFLVALLNATTNLMTYTKMWERQNRDPKAISRSTNSWL
jgi:(heptosyl)LPS beta-1,4-glucosyltransferase